MEFFTKFALQEISQKEFVESLQELTTQIQKKSHLTAQDYAVISSALPKLNDEVFNAEVELFTKFALYISDRGVYALLDEKGFEGIKLQSSRNEIALFIIRRVYQAENYRVLLLFLNGILREQHTPEKKFVLLELFVQILPKIEKREYHLPTLLPLILIVINEGLQKYLLYRQEQHNNTLKDSAHTKLYMQNYQKWTQHFLSRIFAALKQQPEIKAQETAIKELHSIDTMYEYEEHRLSQRPENNKLLVKHYTLLFILDLIQGILEAESSMHATGLDKSVVNELLKTTLDTLTAIHDNRLELIENYLTSVRFSIQNDKQIPKQYHSYDSSMTYNPMALCFLADQVLSSPFAKILSTQYQLRICIGLLYEQSKLQQAKCDVQATLVSHIVRLLNEETFTTQLRSPLHFMTPFHEIVLQIMEKAGSGIKDEIQYINAWKKSQSLYPLDTWTRILEQCIKQSSNVPMLAHMINYYRSTYAKYDNLRMVQEFDIIINALKSKQLGGIEARIPLAEAVILLVLTEVKRVDKDNATIKQHLAYVQILKQEIQLAFDYISVEKQDDQLYSALKNQESALKLAYFNLEKVFE